MKNLAVLLFLIVGLGAKAQQTHTISGIVTDEKGETLPGATVFITNSKHIMSTDADGKFSFNNLPSATYEVVAKMMGFNPAIQKATVKEKPVNITLRLTPNATLLNTVNITAKRSEVPKYQELFMKNFIGQTVNAQRCQLLNPEVLQYDFNAKKNLLKVSANDFLIVENSALGYTLKYLLTNFEMDMKRSICVIKGYPYFEDMTGTVKQQKEWETNRKLAYLSSPRHFFRALMNNSLEKEGFQAFKIIDDHEEIMNIIMSTSDAKKKTDMAYFKEYTDEESSLPRYRQQSLRKKTLLALKVSKINSLFIPDKDNNFRTFFSKLTTMGDTTGLGLLNMITKKSDTTGTGLFNKIVGKNDTTRLGVFIVYTREKQPPLFYETGSPIDLQVTYFKEHNTHRQISKLLPLADTVMFDRNGRTTQAKGFMYTGYWDWQRIADLTPLEYFVDPLAEENK